MATIRERDFAFTLARDAADGDGQTFEGYAAVFNSPTRIRDADGEYDEVIKPGAFKQTINRGKPIFMFNHGKHPLIGDMPLGRFTELREDPRGLFVRARMTDNWLIAPVRDAIRDGAITGMSFRFEPSKESWSGRPSQLCRHGDLRTHHEVRCPELGPVVSPAYADTTAAVRSCFRELEHQVPGILQVKIETRDTVIVGEEEENDPRELVKEAVEALWGLNGFQSECYILEQRKGTTTFVVRGAAQSDHPGYYEVDYTYIDGEVTISDPVLVQPNFSRLVGIDAKPPTDLPAPRSADIPAEERDMSTEAQNPSPSDEAAVAGPSGEAADTPVRTGPLSQADRRQALRRIQLDVRGVNSRKAS